MHEMPGKEKFRGCLIGQALGDALGFVVEGQPTEFCRKYADDVFDRAGDPFEGPVGLRTVQISDAAVVGVMHEAVESLLAEIALHIAAVAAESDAEPAQFDAGLAQRDAVSRAAPSTQSGTSRGQGRCGQHRRGSGQKASPCETRSLHESVLLVFEHEHEYAGILQDGLVTVKSGGCDSSIRGSAMVPHCA